MSTPDRIYVPDRPSDIPEYLVEGGVPVVHFTGESVAEHTDTWNLSEDHPERYRLMLSTPYLLSSWLLKSTELVSINELPSPFAKLELVKEEDKRTRLQRGGMANYGFRLVSLEETEKPENGPVELTEFKLIAGKYSFQRSSDSSALLDLALALRKFKIGELKLNDYQAWEAHFHNDLEQLGRRG